MFCFTDCLRQAMKIETVIDEVFGGQNVNTVICRECLTVSDIAVITYCANVCTATTTLLALVVNNPQIYTHTEF